MREVVYAIKLLHPITYQNPEFSFPNFNILSVNFPDFNIPNVNFPNFNFRNFNFPSPLP